MATTTQACKLCGDVVPSTGVAGVEGFLPGFSGWSDRSPLRRFVQDGTALLHHRCSHQSARETIDPDRNWFACQVAERSIDADAVFDPYCTACEARWIADGASFWNE